MVQNLPNLLQLRRPCAGIVGVRFSCRRAILPILFPFVNRRTALLDPHGNEETPPNLYKTRLASAPSNAYVCGSATARLPAHQALVRSRVSQVTPDDCSLQNHI